MYRLHEQWMDDNGTTWIMMYMIVDFALQPMMEHIYIVHHIFSLMLCSYDISVHDVVERNLPLNKLTRRVFFYTEWSTILLSLGRITRSKRMFLVFAACFVYCRIYSIFQLYWRHISQFHGRRDIAGLGLYALNCHWLFQIADKCAISDPVQEAIMYVLHGIMMMYECRWTMCLWSLLAGFAGKEWLMLFVSFFFMTSPTVALLPYFQLAIYYWCLKKKKD